MEPLYNALQNIERYYNEKNNEELSNALSYYHSLDINSFTDNFDIPLHMLNVVTEAEELIYLEVIIQSL